MLLGLQACQDGGEEPLGVAAPVTLRVRDAQDENLVVLLELVKVGSSQVHITHTEVREPGVAILRFPCLVASAALLCLLAQDHRRC